MADQSWVSLRSGNLSAEIDPNGAQLSVLKDRTGKDLLWNGDPAVWTGRAPILFPIVGMLVDGQYRLGGQTYQLSRHGFARNKLFSLQATTGNKVVLGLSADESTLKVYPFQFQLDVQFELSGNTLEMTATVANRGGEDMPFSIGWHPGFCWPLPYGQARSSHFIQFETDEPDGIRRIDAAGLLKPERLPTPIVNRTLALRDDLFQNDAMIFDRIKSHSVIYGCSAGPRLRVSFPDTPYLGIWTKPGGQFICIEPWHGVTDAQGFSDDFAHKPGVRMIARGASMSASVSVTLLE